MAADLPTVRPAAGPHPVNSSGHSEHGGQQTAMAVSAARSGRVAGAASAQQHAGMSPEPRSPANPPLAPQLLSESQVAASDAHAAQRAAEQQEQAQKLLESLQALREVKGWTLDFTLSETSGRPVVQVLDSDSKTLIRQIPSEEMLALREWLQQPAASYRGLLLDKEV